MDIRIFKQIRKYLGRGRKNSSVVCTHPEIDIIIEEIKTKRKRKEYIQHDYNIMAGIKQDIINNAKKRKTNDPKKYWRNMNNIGTILPEWINGREIRIFNYSKVPDYCLEPVTEGIKELVKEINLDFEVKTYGIDNHVEKCVDYMKDGEVDFKGLINLFLDEPYRKTQRGGKHHADVIILDQKAPYNEVDWGYGHFQQGIIFMYLPKQRQQSTNFIKRIAKHEAVHLLSLGYHHDFAVNNLKNVVRAYNAPLNCVFEYSASTSDLCNMCKDALVYNWRDIEQKTGKRFFKDFTTTQ